MWELDHKEGWMSKNWCFWTVVLEDSSESLGLQGDLPKGNQSWILIGRTDAEAEAPILSKRWLIRQDPDAGKDWRQEEKELTGRDRWMASHTQWTGVWASSGRWWRIGKPGVLQSKGSQRVGHYWATEQQQDRNINTITLVGLGDFICNNLSVTSTFIEIKKKKKKKFGTSLVVQ